MNSNRKILLVDDDKDDQFFFVQAIKNLVPDMDCGIANHGIEALEHLEKVPPPPLLIFLDLNMPFMNGFEFLEKLKKINSYKEIPVIIFTTSNHLMDKERTLALGANMFNTKPIDFKSLKTTLHGILQNFAIAM